MRRIAGLYPGEAMTDARNMLVIADATRLVPQTLRSVDLEMVVGFDDGSTREATRVSNRLRRSAHADLPVAGTGTGAHRCNTRHGRP